jgi:hypothetical protein
MLLGPLERANLNHWLALSKGPNRIVVCTPSLEGGNRFSFLTIGF